MLKLPAMTTLIQPEDLLPKDYRSKEVAYILAETQKLNSLGILQYENTSYGLTNLLRYVCYNKNVKRVIDYHYFDNDWLFTFQKDLAIKHLEDAVNSSQAACCIIVGQIQSHCIEQTFAILSSLRNMHKHKVCFLLEIKLREGEKLENLPSKFNYLLASNYFFLTPLNRKDLLGVISRMAKKYDTVLTKAEVENICESCKGNLSKAKELITGKHVKSTWGDPQVNTNPSRVYIKDGYLILNNKVIENEFTKNESLIFKLFLVKEALVSRDDVANVVAPEGMGDGVTDELIDQAVSRLRKKLEKLKINYSIKTVRGRGYLGESQ
jgi:hypothetical protein